MTICPLDWRMNMSAIKPIRILFLLTLGLALALPAWAQTNGKSAAGSNSKAVVGAGSPSDSAVLDGSDDPEDLEVKQIANYYTNYLSEYRLGPQDMISVEVFGQCPDYCRHDVIVPPTARMSYPLVREGVFVGGRTVEQVADDITKKLEEFIIDPKVTVTLTRPGSARYAVMGKVGLPGVRVMDRRISINEAIMEAGGLAKGANKDKVFIARFSPDGIMMKEQVDIEAIERGKIPTIFLRPGDQVLVGEKGFTWSKLFNVIGQISAARILFGSPF